MKLVCSNGQIYELSAEETRFGRTHQADIAVDDERMSGVHFKIVKRGSTFLVVDNNSTNGTWLNEQEVVHPRTLKEGDTIHAGQVTFRVSLQPEKPYDPFVTSIADEEDREQIHAHAHALDPLAFQPTALADDCGSPFSTNPPPVSDMAAPPATSPDYGGKPQSGLGSSSGSANRYSQEGNRPASFVGAGTGMKSDWQARVPLGELTLDDTPPPAGLRILMALGYPFSGERGLRRMSILILMNFIPLIGSFISLGYLVRVARQSIQGSKNLPVWNESGGDFMRGFQVILGATLYFIPLLILHMLIGLVIYMVIAVTAVERLGESSFDLIMSGGLIGAGQEGLAASAVMHLLLVLYAFLLPPVLFSAMARFAATNAIGSYLNLPGRFGDSLSRPFAMIWLTIIVVFYTLIGGLMIGIGLVLLIIPGLFLSVVFAIAMAHLVGQWGQILGLQVQSHLIPTEEQSLFVYESTQLVTGAIPRDLDDYLG